MNRHSLLDLSKKAYRKLFPVKPSDWQLRASRDQLRLKQVLPRLIEKDSNCLDIGAHKGYFIDLFRTLAPNGEHYAFEPLPELYDELRTKYPEVRSMQLALSNTTGNTTFNKVVGSLAWSGLKPQEYPQELEVQEIIVQTNRLDNVLPQSKKIDFIKIDVEGAEMEVLKGAIGLITRYKPRILFEHALIHTSHYHVTPTEIFNYFSAIGMDVYRCDLSLQYSEQQFSDICYASYNSNYNRVAETNFIALNSQDFN
jgi:FkbM family methyltransferase